MSNDNNDKNDIQWYEYHDDSGKPYYHNIITKETTWVAPVSDYIKSNSLSHVLMLAYPIYTQM